MIFIKNQVIYPYIFEPIFKDYIWGGTNLLEYGKKLTSNRTAESWEASCHPNGISFIKNGVLRKKALDKIIDKYKDLIVGTNLVNKKYPILVKFVDSNDKLSIQVHPDDEYAKRHENGESGKNEMWYIISAKPDACIYHGLKKGISKKDLSKAISDGKVEDCLKKVHVYPGDIISIPAGTIHGLCEGITLIEVQQNSDTTYRIFDYNRTDANGKPLRELHIKKALDVINYNAAGKSKLEGIKYELGNNGYKKILTANKYFACELWNISGAISLKSDIEKFLIYTIIDGNLRIYYRKSFTDVSKGESFMIPSGLGKHIFEGRFIGIKSYVPDLESDIYGPLISAGYKRDYIFDCIN